MPTFANPSTFTGSAASGRRRRGIVGLDDLPPVLRERLLREHPELAEKSDKTKTKYNAIPVTDWRGVLYDSKTEKEWAERLDMMMAARQIKRWSYGPRFVIQSATPDRPDLERITYRPDFLIWNLDDSWWVMDAKGVLTREFRRIAKLWVVIHPRNPLIVGFKDGSMREVA